MAKQAEALRGERVAKQAEVLSGFLAPYLRTPEGGRGWGLQCARGLAASEGSSARSI